MSDVPRHLDRASLAIIVVTLVLFVAALIVKGFSHDLLLEAGVFLVSVKLILMAYKNSVIAHEVSGRLDEMHSMLRQMEGLVRTDARDPGRG